MMAIRIGTVFGLLFAAAFGVTSTAHTANLSMATPAKLDVATSTISASVLAPALCTNRAGLTNVLVAAASGNLKGGNANDLLLGRGTATTINGGNGLDCLIGGAGVDAMAGQGGIGDICIGNGGTDTFNGNCETPIQ